MQPPFILAILLGGSDLPYYSPIMPRQPRNFEVGGIYHVLNRGVEKRNIFEKSQDYSRFILGLYHFNNAHPSDIWANLQKEGRSVLSRAGRDPLVDILCFVLMPNHYHLILREIRKGGIIAFMHKMAGYATYFNKQYDRVGSLFQSRYKAVQIKDDTQLANTFVYVHTNPVELWEPKWKELRVSDAVALFAN